MMSGTVRRTVETAVIKRYEAFLRVSQTLISIRSSEELFSILARELRAVMNFSYLGVAIYDEKAQEVRLTSYLVGVPASTVLDNSLLRRGDSIPGGSRDALSPTKSPGLMALCAARRWSLGKTTTKTFVGVSHTAPVLRAIIDGCLKRSGVNITPAHETEHVWSVIVVYGDLDLDLCRLRRSAIWHTSDP